MQGIKLYFVPFRPRSVLYTYICIFFNINKFIRTYSISGFQICLIYSIVSYASLLSVVATETMENFIIFMHKIDLTIVLLSILSDFFKIIYIVNND